MKSDFLSINSNEVLKNIIQRFTLEKTVLRINEITRSEIEDLNILESENDSLIRIKIPYTGGNYFNVYKISGSSIPDITWSFRQSHILSVFEDHIQFSISFDRKKALNDNEYLEKKIKNRINIYFEQVELLNSKIGEFNSSLPKLIEEKISAYKRSIIERETIANTIGIPLESYQKVPKTVIDLIEKERPLKTLDTQFEISQSNELKEILLEKAYWDILSIFYDVGVVMERNPLPFVKFKENSLRNILLAVLSAFYKGIPTGETFSVKGNSDILLFKEKKSLFVCECKIRDYRGRHSDPNYIISDAIKQISKYLTWSDEKTAIIVFNKRDDTTMMIKETKKQIQNSKDFLGFSKILESISISSDRILSFKLRHPKDIEKQFVLSYLFLNLSTKGLTKIPKRQKKRR